MWKGVKVRFDWGGWWKAERIGLIWCEIVAIAIAVDGAVLGEWGLAIVGLGCALFGLLWAFGWQLILLLCLIFRSGGEG